MGKLPNDIKLSPHARQRLYERKQAEIKYNMSNITRSSVKWYGKDNLIHDCALYRHCCYVTRKSNQIGYMTDGDIEIIYNKNTHVAITVLEVKEKFKPIIQFIKPELIKQIEKKKEKKKMELSKPICQDCGKEVELSELNKHGVCIKCVRRKNNMKARGREYIPYLELPENEQKRIDSMQEAQSKRNKQITEPEPEPELTVPDNNSYYISKANQEEVTTHPMMKPIIKPVKLDGAFDPLSDQASFIKILRDCGCEIPEESLENVLDILVNTDKLKDIFMIIAKGDSQQAMLDLEQGLGVIEKKLQHDWEYNGFQEADDIKFKGFLTWRRVLKGAIYFWKKLYSTNTIIEMQRAWNSYIQNPDDKLSTPDNVNKPERMESNMKRWQITTESISTIFNTRKPFTRVFYATDKENAYRMFREWMTDRNLHENKNKTTIVELKVEGEDGRKINK